MPLFKKGPVGLNIKELKKAGKSEADATRIALKGSGKGKALGRYTKKVVSKKKSFVKQ